MSLQSYIKKKKSEPNLWNNCSNNNALLFSMSSSSLVALHSSSDYLGFRYFLFELMQSNHCKARRKGRKKKRKETTDGSELYTRIVHDSFCVYFSLRSLPYAASWSAKVRSPLLCVYRSDLWFSVVNFYSGVLAMFYQQVTMIKSWKNQSFHLDRRSRSRDLFFLQ